MSHPFDDETAPVYVISVAAQLSGLHPQTLRTYDRLGLVSPSRTAGRGRRYSMRDIVQLRAIQRLSQEEGINLSGIKHILDLQRDNDRLRAEVTRAHLELTALANELESTRAVAARLARRNRGDAPDTPGSDLVPIRRTSVVLWRAQTPRPHGRD